VEDPNTHEQRWSPYRVEKIFTSEAEAREYAARNGITDVRFDEQ
jgi:hypothetical protein